jgi:predicted nucleotidyltransferase
VRVFYRRHSRDEIVRAIAAGVRRLAASLPIREAVLFGSCAANRHTAASDVDVLIVYSGPPRAEAFQLVKEAVALPRLEPHVYSESEAAALAPVLARMARHGIRVHPPASDVPGPCDQPTTGF